MNKPYVKIWEEDVTIPTYPVAKPEKNPMFLEKRVYQGSSGKVYPLPIIEKIYDNIVDKVYKAVFLENEYIQVMILPELGGRIQRAVDKTNNNDFVYHNRVIKPALIGLIGPWISGGIEFNWPQHHRPSTFMPVEYYLEENADGSKTCFISEIDQMYGTKGLAAYTLYPGKSYLEIKGQLYNRTELPQTFLWWANPAVAVNDHTQLIFPPDVHAVMDHGKRDVSRFPIATGTYYKMDYSSGVDISRYKNIPVPTSYMAYHSDYDFVGAYDHKLKVGILHVANHQISPGKKQWTWGCGDFGQAWDRNLTDEDGPYIELMTGVFTDNQPDFTWLQPYEEKQFVQYFMPYKNIGAVKNATVNAAVNLEVSKDNINIFVYASSVYEKAKIVLIHKKEKLWEDIFTLSPNHVYEHKLHVNNLIETELKLQVYDNNNKLLVSYQPQPKTIKPVPEPAKKALDPADIKTTEELFLTALHLEQYRHATYEPDVYYLEGLKRDETDIRLNNGYGLLLYRRGLFTEAEKYFKKAVQKLKWKNPNPYDSEPIYNLGLSLLKQNKVDEAYNAFYKATWSHAQQDRAFYRLACISAQKGNIEDALLLVEQSIIKNYHNTKARGLKTALLMKLNLYEMARKFNSESIEIDKLDHYSRFLMCKIDNNDANKSIFIKSMRDSLNNYLTLALDLAEGGLYKEATEVLDLCALPSPLLYYYKAYFNQKLNKQDLVKANLELAQKQEPLYCFPNKLEEKIILEAMIKLNPADSYAHYYLGNLLYDKKQYSEAISHWEQSAKLNDRFPTVFRNLALAYFNKENNKEKAKASLEKSFYLDTTDARVLFELDQLYKNIGMPHQQRLKFLNTYLNVVKLRDDLYLEYSSLYNYTEQNEKAYQLIMERQFHPWEGGEGKVPTQYKHALVEMAKKKIKQEKYQTAIELLKQATIYPHNLGEGKLAGTQENNINYYLGVCYEAIDENEQAKHYYDLASIGLTEPTDAMYYNDQPADMIYYQGLALIKLDRVNEAKARFNKLIDYGENHIFDNKKIDYFAVSLPDFLIFDTDLNKKNVAHCQYLIGLGNLGLGNDEAAKKAFTEVLKLDINHLGALTHIK